MKRGKKYAESAKLVEKLKLYDTEEGLELCIKTAKAKFDETVEIHVRLGVDSRHADQQVRGAVVLPNGTGKSVRVLAFCKTTFRRPSTPAPSLPARMSMFTRSSRKAGWILTS